MYSIFEDVPIGAIALFIMMLMFWLVIAIRKKNNRTEFSAIFLILFFFFVRGILSLLNSIYEFRPLITDAQRYHDSALRVADYIHQYGFYLNNLIIEARWEPAWVVPLGGLYSIFGDTEFIGFIINTFFFSLASYRVYCIGKILYGRKAGLMAVLVFSLLPYSLLHSTYLLRDPLINYLLAEFFFRVLVITESKKFNKANYVWLFAVSAYTGLLRRENLVMITILLMILLSFWIVKKRSKIFLIKSLLLVIVIGLVSGVILINLDSWFFRDFSKLVDITKMQHRFDAIEARSIYLSNQQFNSLFDVIKYAPIRAVYFLFSPFPWDMFKIQQYIPFFESVIVFITLLYSYPAFKYLKQRNVRFFYVAVIYLFLGIVGSGLMQNNSAGSQRHRTQFTFLIIAITVPYIYVRRKRKHSLHQNQNTLIPGIEDDFQNVDIHQSLKAKH